MEPKTKEQILADLKGQGWRVTGERPDTDPGDVVTGPGEFPGSPPTTRRGEVPNGNTVWILTGPNRESDEIVVKQTRQQSGGEEASPQAAGFIVVKGPEHQPPTTPQRTDTQPAKGTRRIVQEGGRWVQQQVVDDKGTWSVETGDDGKPISVPIDKPAPTSSSAPTTKTVNGHTYQWNPTTNIWNESGLPVETPAKASRKTQVLGTGPNDQFTVVLDTETGEVISSDRNINYKPPAPAPRTLEQSRTEAAQATVAEAGASTAQQTAEANLSIAQTNARKALIDLQDAERRASQSPTNAEAQQAKATYQRQLDLANQQLEAAIKQSANLNPIAVEQAQATLEATRAATKKNILGDLAGMREQIAEIKSLVKSGEITPQQGDMMIEAQTQGTSPFNLSNTRTTNQLTQRQQDVSGSTSRFGNLTSFAGQSFQTLSDMNKYAAVGSTKMADAYAALIGTMLRIAGGPQAFQQPPSVVNPITMNAPSMAQNQAQNTLASMIAEAQRGQGPNTLYGQGSAQQPNGPGNSFQTNQPGVPGSIVPAAAATQSAAAPAPAGVSVTFNVGSGGASVQSAQPEQPAPYSYTPETAPQSEQRNWGNLSNMIGTAAHSVAASEDDIKRAYGVA